VVQTAAHGGKKCPHTIDTRSCPMGPCPVHCQVSNWSPYSGCSLTCGTGSQIRKRIVTRHAQHGGYVCPFLSDKRHCNTQKCPVDCRLSAWGAWDSYPGGKGEIKRTRSVVVKPKYGGKPCKALSEKKVHECKSQKKYGKWSECTKKCGTGHQWRNVEEIKCSKTSAMKFHMQFRDGRACNTKDCSMKQDDTHQAVKVARVESLHKVVGTSMRR
jgi:hypothetical protein